MFRLGAWTIDPALRQISDGSATTRLSPKAMAVLEALGRNGCAVMSRAELLDEVWAGVTVGEEVLTHAIAELRRAFGDSARNPQIVETVHRAGYRLKVPAKPVPQGDDDAALEDAADATRPDPPRAPEIKRVTIVMVDLGEAAADLAQQGPEVAEAAFEALASLTASVVARFDGTVIERLNDLVVVAFGAPVAIDDRAVRAANAALALRQEADPGQPLRLAISSGEVIQRAGLPGRPLQLSGLPLSVATAMLAHMPGGQIRLDQSTRRSLGPALACRRVAQKTPGVRDDVHELLGFDPSPETNALVTGAFRSPFVSRNIELALLHESAREARAGRGRIVAISGEAGIGKTRLFAHFLSELPASDWRIVTAAAPRDLASPFRGAARLVGGYLGIGPNDDEDTAARKLAARLDELGGHDDLLAPLSTLFYLPVDDERFNALTPAMRVTRIEDALCRVLALEAERKPVVLVVEDLHWTDPRSAGVLSAILPLVASNRILVLLNHRPHHNLDLGGLPNVTQRTLDALPPEAERQLLDAMIGDCAELEPVKRFVGERARGNALFAEELVSSLVDKGVLQGSNGAFGPGKPLVGAALDTPATIEDVLAARIDRLAPDDKSLLQICAAIGPEARPGLIAAVSERPDADLRQSLSRLQTADLLRQDRLEADGRVAFKHAMTHAVAQRGLHSDRRRDIHRRIAEAIERQRPNARASEAPRLAEHWTQAGAPARAIPYWQTAGRAAQFRGANRTAARYLRSALALIAEVPDSIDRQWRELELCLALGVVLVAAEGLGSSDARVVYERAEHLAGWLGAKREQFIAQWGLHHNSETREAFPQAVELTYRMTETARASGDPTLLLQASHAGWATRLAQGRLDDVLSLTADGPKHYAQCDNHADAERFAGHDPLACAMSHASIATCLKGDAQTALAQAQAAMEHANTVNHPTSIGHALSFLAKIRFLRDEPDKVRSVCERLTRLADEHGLVDFADIATFLGGWAAWRRDGIEAARPRLKAANAAADRLSKTTAEILLVPAAAEMRAATGDVDDALAMIEEALVISRKKGVALADAELHRVAAGLAARAPGDHGKSAALERLRQAHTIATAQGATVFADRAEQEFRRSKGHRQRSSA